AAQADLFSWRNRSAQTVIHAGHATHERSECLNSYLRKSHYLRATTTVRLGVRHDETDEIICKPNVQQTEKTTGWPIVFGSPSNLNIVCYTYCMASRISRDTRRIA
ncbi:unnamed protein product, partial [Laminaria digitata]